MAVGSFVHPLLTLFFACEDKTRQDKWTKGRVFSSAALNYVVRDRQVRDVKKILNFDVVFL